MLTLRKHFAFALAALVALALTGCMKMKAQTTLKKDGKGTYVQQVTINMKAVAEMKAMFAGMGGAAEEEEDDDPKSQFEKAAATLKYADGVRLVKKSFAMQDSDAKAVGSMEVEFDSLKQLYLSGIAGDISVKLEDLGEGSWKLTQGLEMKGMPSASPDSEAGQQQAAQIMGMVGAFMGDMEMKFGFALPGTITETTGAKSDDSKAVSYGGNFKAIMDPKNRSLVVTFKAPGATLTAFALTKAEIEASKAKLEAKVDAARKAEAAKKAAAEKEAAEKEPAGAGG